ncbi:MAG: hypothetical protein JSR54_16325 [Proteobacteria bacterium]|nr:hypothetical protein [Pseudomonadota bacterium]
MRSGRFRTGVPLAAGALLLAACASTAPHALPRYRPPPAMEPAATIDVGTRAHAWSVDGAETPAFARTVRVAPGVHRVGLNCLSFELASVDAVASARGAAPVTTVMAHTAVQSVVVTGPFEAGRTYYARCVATDGMPRAWLASAPDGSDLPPGFESICTRSCPK